MSQPTYSPGTQLWARCRARFTVAAWSEFRAGDALYYLMHGGRSGDASVYGPFTVVCPEAQAIRNQAGVTFTLHEVTLLKLCNP